MDRVRAEYLERRRKEDLSFMVVRFLRAYETFEGIYDEFQQRQQEELGFKGCGLFEKVKDLEERLVFDIKEKAHFLFRPGPANREPAAEPELAEVEKGLLLGRDVRRDGGEARRALAELRRSLINRSIDSYVGTGFHMFMILRESLYQLEHYVPQFLAELESLERIEYLAQKIGYLPDEEEERELLSLRDVIRFCQTIASDTRELCTIALERCRSLFRESATVLRHFLQESEGNEVLVLNLLAEQELVERVYGTGSCEEILAHIFRKFGRPEQTGVEKAREFALQACGNVEALDLRGAPP
jgi:hypothetical protein